MKILSWSQKRPENITNFIEVAGCVCEFNGKILFLKRAPGTLQENTWGLPAGKLEALETAEEAVVREIFEETSISLHHAPIKNIGSLYIHRSDANVAFHIFYVKFSEIPSITLLEKENVEARWLPLQEAYNLPLIIGGSEALQVIEAYLQREMTYEKSF